MITDKCLPTPQVIAKILQEALRRKTKEELSAELETTPNTIRAWISDPEKMRVSSLISIAKYAEKHGFSILREWQEEVLAQDGKVVFLRSEWHGNKQEYVCERSKNVPPKALIMYAGELCIYKPNDRGVPQAESFFTDQLYQMDQMPDHEVIGALGPIEPPTRESLS